jgi:hypothetical protein
MTPQCYAGLNGWGRPGAIIGTASKMESRQALYLPA